MNVRVGFCDRLLFSVCPDCVALLRWGYVAMDMDIHGGAMCGVQF